MTVLDAVQARQGSLLDVARLLIVIQGAVKLLSVLEVIVVGLAIGTISEMGPTLLPTAGGAILAFTVAAGLGRRARWARRLAILGETLALVGTTIDLLLSLFLAQSPLGPVPLAVGMVLPASVIWILRRHDVRSEFQPAVIEETAR